MVGLVSSPVLRSVVVCLLGTAAGTVAGLAAAGGAYGAAAGAVLGAMVGAGWLWLTSSSSRRPRFERLADSLARVALLLLVVTIAFGLLAGTAIVIVWRPNVDWQVYNRPYEIQGLGMLLILGLSLPSLLLGAWHSLRGRRQDGAPRLLAFFGPLIVFVVGEGLTPHLEIPWHQIVHTFFGALPLAVVYWFTLRKWHPSILPFRR